MSKPARKAANAAKNKKRKLGPNPLGQNPPGNAQLDSPPKGLLQEEEAEPLPSTRNRKMDWGLLESTVKFQVKIKISYK
jgi:hypothetical protein